MKGCGTKGCLVVLIFAALAVFMLIGLSRARPTNPGVFSTLGLTCAAETGEVPDYNGVGIMYSTNVDVHLEAPSGRRISPSRTEALRSDGDGDYAVKVYLDDVLAEGEYTAQVYYGNARIQAYSIDLNGRDAVTFSIVCR